MKKSYVYEVVTWQARNGVSAEEMIEAVANFGKVVKGLPGFLHQALYQRDNGCWVDVYYWETEEEAIASNDAVADEPTFHHLMSLLDAESVAIEILAPQQEEGVLMFG